MKVKTKLIIGSVALLMLLSACSLIGPVFGILPNSSMGILLTVDSDGHFKEDIEYDYGDFVVSYGSDGSYTEYTYDYSETEDGVVLSETVTGTYTWNPETYVADYHFINRTYHADDTVVDLDYDHEVTSYFTNRIEGVAYVLTSEGGSTWERTSSYTYSDDTSTSYNYTYTILSSGISYSYLYESMDATGTLTAGTESEREYDIIGLYPENAQWKSGQSVTFTLEETVDRTRTVTAGVFGDWVDNTLNRATRSIGNAGEFMFFNELYTAKTVEEAE